MDGQSTVEYSGEAMQEAMKETLTSPYQEY